MPQKLKPQKLGEREGSWFKLTALGARLGLGTQPCFEAPSDPRFEIDQAQ